jgi:hypothetical protein
MAWCAPFHGVAAGTGRGAGLALTELADAGKKVATIQRHAAAIAKAHELVGLDLTLRPIRKSRCCSGIAREKKTRTPQKW